MDGGVGWKVCWRITITSSYKTLFQRHCNPISHQKTHLHPTTSSLGWVRLMDAAMARKSFKMVGSNIATWRVLLDHIGYCSRGSTCLCHVSWNIDVRWHWLKLHIYIYIYTYTHMQQIYLHIASKYLKTHAYMHVLVSSSIPRKKHCPVVDRNIFRRHGITIIISSSFQPSWSWYSHLRVGTVRLLGCSLPWHSQWHHKAVVEHRPAKLKWRWFVTKNENKQEV